MSDTPIFTPTPWQEKAFRDKSRILLLSGGSGSGKSTIAAIKLHEYLLHYPGSNALMVRKTRQSMINSTVLFMQSRIMKGDRRVTHYPSKNRFEYTNGSMLYYGGMANEEQREQLRSIGQEGGLEFIWAEEANRLTETDYQELLTRLRGTRGKFRQFVLSTNPDAFTHWINQRLILGNEATVMQTRPHDNPYLPKEYIEETLAKFVGVQKARFYDGIWRNAEGAVYANYDQRIHLIESFEPPRSWRRIRSIDFGYRAPACVQWWAIDGNGTMYLYKELYQTNTSARQLALLTLENSRDEEIEYTVADWDAEGQAEFAMAGIPTINADKNINLGIQLVTSRLNINPETKKPGILFMNDALIKIDPILEAEKHPLCTAEEIEGYIWKPDKQGRNRYEVPIDINNHGMDAMRYAVMGEEMSGMSGQFAFLDELLNGTQFTREYDSFGLL